MRHDQGVDRAADGLAVRITEQPFGAAVPVQHFARWRGDGDRVRSLAQDQIGERGRQSDSFARLRTMTAADGDAGNKAIIVADNYSSDLKVSDAWHLALDRREAELSS